MTSITILPWQACWYGYKQHCLCAFDTLIKIDLIWFDYMSVPSQANQQKLLNYTCLTPSTSFLFEGISFGASTTLIAVNSQYNTINTLSLFEIKREQSIFQNKLITQQPLHFCPSVCKFVRTSHNSLLDAGLTGRLKSRADCYRREDRAMPL